MERRDPDDKAAGSQPLLSTAILLEKAREGDDRALGEIFQRYADRLRRWASGRLPARARDGLETEDLVQEAFIQSARHIDTFDVRWKGSFHYYLRRAILNKIRDQVRRAEVRDRALEQAGGPLAEADSPLETVIGIDALERYEKALERLDASDRELVVGRIELDTSYEELAEMTGKPTADAARVALKRALVRVAREMEEHHGAR